MRRDVQEPFTMRKSFKEFLSGFCKHFFMQVLPLLLFLVVDLFGRYFMSWPIPSYVPWAVLAVAVFISSFLTYHDLRRQGIKPFSLPEHIWQRTKERLEKQEPYLSRFPRILRELGKHTQQLVDEVDMGKINKKKLKKVVDECLKAIKDLQAIVPYSEDKARDKVQKMLNDNRLGIYELISDNKEADKMREELQQLGFNTSHEGLKAHLKDYFHQLYHMGEALLLARYMDVVGMQSSSVHDWIETKEEWMENLNQLSTAIVRDIDEILSMGAIGNEYSPNKY